MTEQEKRKTVNHFLTLYIGECPHKDWDYKPRLVGRIWTDFWKCGTCKYETENIRFANPDFFAPNDFDRLRKWMEENEAELWSRYLRTIYRDTILHSALLNSLPILFREWLNPSNLFEFLKEKRSDWGYIDTHIGNMADGKIVHRDIHPAAAYLDSLEGK